MINPLPSHDVMRVLATDPGTQTAGFSIVDANLVTRQFTVLLSQTYKGAKVLKMFGDLKELHEERYLRNMGYGKVYADLLDTWCPHTVASETTYMGSFPATFKALTEQITVWRSVAFNWNPSRPFYLYEPSRVKKGLGVGGKTNDKELMRAALAKRKDIFYGNDIDLSCLDEHEIDSICVAIHHIQSMNLWTQTLDAR